MEPRIIFVNNELKEAFKDLKEKDKRLYKELTKALDWMNHKDYEKLFEFI